MLYFFYLTRSLALVLYVYFRTLHVSFPLIMLYLVNLTFSRLEKLPVLKVQLRTRCSLGWLLRPEVVAVFYALAEVCAWAWELLPEQLQGQPKAEDLVKDRGQR